MPWLVERGIEPHIPVWDRSKVAPQHKFTRADFIYDDERDVYVCPNGKELRTSGTAYDGTSLKYIAKRSDCERCPPKPRCTVCVPSLSVVHMFLTKRRNSSLRSIFRSPRHVYAHIAHRR